jgi:hypothetical protein
MLSIVITSRPPPKLIAIFLIGLAQSVSYDNSQPTWLRPGLLAFCDGPCQLP